MTLIEMLVVVVIIALVATGIVFGMGVNRRSQLRSACTRITSGARFAFHRAVVTGNTLRMAIDLDENTLTFEETETDIVLQGEEDGLERESEDDEAATDPWAAAQARLESTLVVSTGRSSFHPIAEGGEERARGSRADLHPDPRYFQRGLEGANATRLITSHEREPRETGTGYVYFWPTGQAERAYIQLEDSEGELVYTVEIDALTGRGRIYPYALEPEDIEDEAEVRDPG